MPLTKVDKGELTDAVNAALNPAPGGAGNAGQVAVVNGAGDGYELSTVAQANVVGLTTGDSPTFAGLKTTGNVGIGETSPGAPLQITANSDTYGIDFLILKDSDDTAGSVSPGIEFQNNVGTTTGRIYGGTGDNDSQSLIFRTGTSTTNHMQIDVSGNVGIGGAPDEAFVVAVADGGILKLENAANPVVLQANVGGGGNSMVGFNLHYQSGFKYMKGTAKYAGGAYYDINAGTFKIVGTSATGNAGATASVSENVIVDSSGNVGIGTTPSYPLHVTGTGVAVSIMTQLSALLTTTSGNAVAVGSDGTDAMIGPGDSGSSLHLLSKSGGVLSKAITINSSSNVGIGVTPSARLHVSDTTASNQYIIQVAGSGQTSGFGNFLCGADTDRVGLILSDGGTGRGIWVDNSQQLRILTSGTFPSANTSGSVVGTQTSSRDTKQDIALYTDYSEALQMILNAPLNTFRYKNEVIGYGETADTRLGFISDEVDPLFMCDNGKSIDQVSVNGILMACIKELTTRLEALEAV